MLLDELRRLGLDENTLVIFTSDNGSRAPGRGRQQRPAARHKGTTWEGGQRVPCIVRWPGAPPAGPGVRGAGDLHGPVPDASPRSPAPRRPSDRGIDGRDLAPVLFDHDGSPHESFAYYAMNDLCAVRSGRWKLHVARDGAACAELYDLADDGGETTDVSADHPGVVQRLSALAEGYRQRLGDARLGVDGEEVRPIGRVPVGRMLTTYDPDHAYYAAEYDLPDRG